MARGSVFTRKAAKGLVWYMKLEMPRRPGSDRKSIVEKCPPHVHTKAQAEKAATIRQGEIDAAGHLDLATSTLATYMAEYSARRALFGEIRAASLIKYRTQAAIISKALGSRRMDRITTAELQAFIEEMKRSGRTGYTVNQYGTFLRMIFHDAITAGHMAVNPMQRVRIPPATPRAQDVLTRAEADTLLRAARHDDLWPIWLFFLQTGVRIGEILALRWTDLDIPKRTARIQRALTVEHRDGPPKTKAGFRVVYYPDELAIELALHYQRQHERDPRAPWTDRGLVFPDNVGEYLHPDRVRKRLYTLCQQARVPTVSPHDLRRTFCQLLIEDGDNPRAVADIMGHSNMGETIGSYTQATRAMGESTRQRIGRLLSASGEQRGEQPPPADDTPSGGQS